MDFCSSGSAAGTEPEAGAEADVDASLAFNGGGLRARTWLRRTSALKGNVDTGVW